jgi:streptogramin lyase
LYGSGDEGLAVDQQGHVYISGADDIHRLSPDGTFRDIVLSKHDGVDRPRGISFTKYKNLSSTKYKNPSFTKYKNPSFTKNIKIFHLQNIKIFHLQL